ncbi:M67 family metallopeptidase [bacterium]|jgi:[CysO sulfur-carrier protein]-S-L-cysteine hydrolase|nr:M67 family metallopeptidase [bacterium]
MKIKRELVKAMIVHSEELNPVESCGYLAGKDNELLKFYPMTNIDNSPEHFSFDPKEQFKVMKEARNDGLRLMSVYHSHPESPARLSEEDLRLLNDPSMVYIIVSLLEKKPDVKGYKVSKQGEDITVERVNLETV